MSRTQADLDRLLSASFDADDDSRPRTRSSAKKTNPNQCSCGRSDAHRHPDEDNRLILPAFVSPEPKERRKSDSGPTSFYGRFSLRPPEAPVLFSVRRPSSTNIDQTPKKPDSSKMPSPKGLKTPDRIFKNAGVSGAYTGMFTHGTKKSGSPCDLKTTTPRARPLKEWFRIECTDDSGGSQTFYAYKAEGETTFAENFDAALLSPREESRDEKRSRIEYEEDFEDALLSSPEKPRLPKRMKTYSEEERVIGPVRVSRETLDRWAQRERKVTQGQVMGGSASVLKDFYPEELNDSDMEWLHLVAFSFGGPDGKNPQQEENLVAGKKSCNSLQAMFEYAIQGLLRDKVFDEVTITVRALLCRVDGNDPTSKFLPLAKKITFEFLINGKTFRTIFNPMESSGLPLECTEAMIRSIIQESLAPPAPPTPSTPLRTRPSR